MTGGCGFIGASFVQLFRINRPDWRLINFNKPACAGNLLNFAGIDEMLGYLFSGMIDIGDAAVVEELSAAEIIDTAVHFAA